MKKLITILFALTLLIVGCGKNAGEKFAEKMASKIAEKAVEAGSGEDVDIDISGDGENGSITIKGKDGEEVKFQGNSKELSKEFPKNVFIVKGEIGSSSSVSSNDGTVFTVEINVDDKSKSVKDKITKKMTNNNFETVSTITSNGNSIITFQKDKTSAMVTINGETENTQVVYIVTVEK